MVKLTDKKIRWAVKQVINKAESTAVVATIYGVSRRRIQQLVKSYKETGEYPVLDRKKRPKTPLSAEERRIIEAAHNEPFLGTRLLRYHAKEHSKLNLLHNKIHRYLLAVWLARPNLQKQNKRTGISRFERHLCLRGINHIPIEAEYSANEWQDRTVVSGVPEI